MQWCALISTLAMYFTVSNLGEWVEPQTERERGKPFGWQFEHGWGRHSSTRTSLLPSGLVTFSFRLSSSLLDIVAVRAHACGPRVTPLPHFCPKCVTSQCERALFRVVSGSGGGARQMGSAKDDECKSWHRSLSLSSCRVKVSFFPGKPSSKPSCSRCTRLTGVRIFCFSCNLCNHRKEQNGGQNVRNDHNHWHLPGQKADGLYVHSARTHGQRRVFASCKSWFSCVLCDACLRFRWCEYLTLTVYACV